MNTYKVKLLIASLLSMSSNSVWAFTSAFIPTTRTTSNDRFAPAAEHQARRRRAATKTGVSMTIDMTLNSIDAIIPTAITIMRSADILISSNESFEAEVLADLAHIALDVATFFSPSTIVLRLVVFVGRILSILSDYIPDHSMTLDEALFQSVLLVVAGNALGDSTMSFLTSTFKPTSFRDRKIYQRVFLPAGFSWMQYKTLISTEVLEWVEAFPNELLIEEADSLLLLYRGEVNQIIDEHHTKTYGTNSNSTVRSTTHIIGNLPWATKYLIDSSSRTKKRRTKSESDSNNDNSNDNQFQVLNLRVGSVGALLLRINVGKLVEVSKGDERLTESTKNLVLNSIQNRLIMFENSDENNNTDYSLLSA